jgi:hypothetical protein
MKNRVKMQECKLKCSTCNNITTIQRRRGELRELGHIKHLWCYKCKDTTAHIEQRSLKISPWEDNNDITVKICQ